MASNVVKSNRMRRLESRKSHSWWWDSHISPKNSKWLQENLEEMDQHVKRMLKLIEEDADSFAKKAAMYYQKRPELISLVEDFYRMYRSLAERYDHVTGELRKNIPSDLQSQGSGISDVGSEPPSSLPSPDRRPARKSGPRAAGFDFFLGGGGTGSDAYSKEGDESSTLDSESESDDSSVNNYPGSHGSDEEQGLRRKIIELEVELREVKEKFVHVEDDENSEVSGKIAMYEEELQAAREKIQLSEEEINRLTTQLQKYGALETPDYKVRELQESTYGPDAEILAEIQTLEEELRITREKLQESEAKAASLSDELANKGSTIQDLQHQLKSSQKEVSTWKNKLEKEKREVAKLMDRVTRYKTNLTERDQEIRGLKEAMSNANKALSEENEQLQAEITRLTKERAYLMDNLKELDFVRQSLEEDVRRAKAGKAEAEAVYLAQIEQLKGDIAEKNENLEELKKTLEALEVKYENGRDNLNIKIDALVVELSSRDDQIDEMNKHLHQLHMEHVELIKSGEELRGRIRELQREVERKEEIILEGAEEKREAIRQLCFSLEHYRNGYHKLREAVMGHKGMPVMAT